MPTRNAPPGGLVTIPNVELARVGTWATSTGVFNFSLEDFESAVAAAQDPEVWDAPLKIGHTDPRFASLDGEPALGWVGRNLRIVGDRLIGDIEKVPAALAALIPTAWPKRSIELAFGVSTPSGKKYRAAVIGLALLGVSKPAVAGLADVLNVYGGDSTFEVAAAASTSTETVMLADGFASPDAVRALNNARTAAAALVTVPGVDPSFSADLLAVIDRMPAPSPTTAPAPGHTGDRANQPPGGPPMPMTEARIRELLNLAADADAEAALVELRNRAAQAPAATTTPGPDPATLPPGTTSAPAPGTTTTPPGDPGTQPGTAPGTTPVPAAPGTPPAGTVPGATTAPVAPAAPVAPVPGAPAAPAGVTPDPAVPAGAVPAFAGVPAGHVLVPADQLGQIQSQAAAGAAAAAQLATQTRETALAAAVSAGRLRPSDLQAWRDDWNAEYSATGAAVRTQAQLGRLPVAFATTPLGHEDPAAAATVADNEAEAAFYASMGWDYNQPAPTTPTA